MIDYFSPEDLNVLLEKMLTQSLPVPEVGTPLGGPTSDSVPIDDRSKEEKQEDESSLYSVSNFSL